MRFRTAIFALPFLTLLILATGCSPKLTGSYQGAVLNQSYNINADLFITFQEVNGLVTGSMTIGAPLYGGGPISGRRDGSDLQFTTGDGNGGSIVWIGRVGSQRVEGTYIVEPSTLSTVVAGAEKQQGVWSVVPR